MVHDITPEALIAHYELEPIPREGGRFRRTWAGPERPDGCPEGTAIVVLLTAKPGDFSALHRLPSDETWHFYLGDPLELLLLSSRCGSRGRGRRWPFTTVRTRRRPAKSSASSRTRARAVALRADLTAESECWRVVREAADWGGGALTALVNNAGVQPTQELPGMTAEDWRAAYDAGNRPLPPGGWGVRRTWATPVCSSPRRWPRGSLGTTWSWTEGCRRGRRGERGSR